MTPCQFFQFPNNRQEKTKIINAKKCQERHIDDATAGRRKQIKPKGSKSSWIARRYRANLCILWSVWICEFGWNIFWKIKGVLNPWVVDSPWSTQTCFILASKNLWTNAARENWAWKTTLQLWTCHVLGGFFWLPHYLFVLCWPYINKHHKPWATSKKGQGQHLMPFRLFLCNHNHLQFAQLSRDVCCSSAPFNR